METKSFVERRQHRRYIVRGRVKFTIDSMDLWGDLVNFGHGGMLIRTRYEFPENAKLDFRVVAYCYPDMFAVPGQVVGRGDSLLAIKFLERTDGAKELLQWLAGENFPWTGGNSSADKERARPWQDPAPNSQQPADEIEVDASMDCIFQYA